MTTKVTNAQRFSTHVQHTLMSLIQASNLELCVICWVNFSQLLFCPIGTPPLREGWDPKGQSREGEGQTEQDCSKKKKTLFKNTKRVQLAVECTEHFLTFFFYKFGNVGRTPQKRGGRSQEKGWWRGQEEKGSVWHGSQLWWLLGKGQVAASVIEWLWPGGNNKAGGTECNKWAVWSLGWDQEGKATHWQRDQEEDSSREATTTCYWKPEGGCLEVGLSFQSQIKKYDVAQLKLKVKVLPMTSVAK